MAGVSQQVHRLHRLLREPAFPLRVSNPTKWNRSSFHARLTVIVCVLHDGCLLVQLLSATLRFAFTLYCYGNSLKINLVGVSPTWSAHDASSTLESSANALEYREINQTFNKTPWSNFHFLPKTQISSTSGSSPLQICPFYLIFNLKKFAFLFKFQWILHFQI